MDMNLSGLKEHEKSCQAVVSPDDKFGKKLSGHVLVMFPDDKNGAELSGKVAELFLTTKFVRLIPESWQNPS